MTLVKRPRPKMIKLYSTSPNSSAEDLVIIMPQK